MAMPQTFKVNLKTADQVDRPERTYQATFDTVDGEPACSGVSGSGSLLRRSAVPDSPAGACRICHQVLLDGSYPHCTCRGLGERLPALEGLCARHQGQGELPACLQALCESLACKALPALFFLAAGSSAVGTQHKPSGQGHHVQAPQQSLPVR